MPNMPNHYFQRAESLLDRIDSALLKEEEYNIQRGASNRRRWIRWYKEAKKKTKEDPRRIAKNGVIYKVREGYKKGQVLRWIRELRDIVAKAPIIPSKIASRAERYIYYKERPIITIKTIDGKEHTFVGNASSEELKKLANELFGDNWIEIEILGVYKDDIRGWQSYKEKITRGESVNLEDKIRQAIERGDDKETRKLLINYFEKTLNVKVERAKWIGEHTVEIEVNGEKYRVTISAFGFPSITRVI